MSLRKQLLFMIASPLLGVLILGTFLGITQFQLWMSAKHTEAHIVDMQSLSELVHALQAERGVSVGFITSGGASFSNSLLENRKLVDEAERFIPHMAEELIADVVILKDIRKRVDRHEAPVPEVAATYTKLIRHALEFSEEALLSQSDATVTRIGAGLVALAEAKEAAGLQRATGAAGFGKGVFSGSQFETFIRLQATEEAQLSTVNTELGHLVENINFAVDLSASGLGELRQIILEAGPNTNISGVSAAEWFKRASDWLSVLHHDEVVALEVAHKTAAKNARTATFLLLADIGVAIGILGFCVFISYRVLKGFENDFTRLTSSVKRLAQKDFEDKGKVRDPNTEIGQLFIAIDAAREVMGQDELLLQSAAQDRKHVLTELDVALRHLSDGDLSKRLETAFPDEYEQLRLSFNEATLKLERTIQRVSDSAANIHSSGAELDGANSELSMHTESQAAALEEMTAATTELTDMVKASATRASDANNIASTLRSEATTGLEDISQVVDAMAQIASSSSDTANLVSIIEDLAFQTNLLALNAGVEAARAGEAGKGFAVVASEVRELAVRATAATTQIGQMIANSSDIVDSGSVIVERAGNSFRSIVDGVQKTGVAMEEIATEAHAQTVSIDELRMAMQNLDRTTQGNSGMVRTSAQRSSELAKEAEVLGELVREFQISSGQADQSMRAA